MAIQAHLRSDLVRLVLTVAVIIKALAFIQLSTISIQPVIASSAMFAAGFATATLGFLG